MIILVRNLMRLQDDGGSRMLMFNNYMAFGAWGVGESCHESQWVHG